jgi:hypothetical protein
MPTLVDFIDQRLGEPNGGAPLNDMVCEQSPRVRDWRIVATSGVMPSDSAPNCAIVVPTRDEAARIAACLEHCRISIQASGTTARLVVLVNNSSDDSVGVAIAWAERQGVALDLVEVELAEGQAHAGAARRLAFDIGRQCVDDAGVLMTTDADSRPERNWVGANLRAVAGGAALVCGRIALDAEEAAALPAGFLTAWSVEETYAQASLELANLLDPDPHNPWPHHGQISGASLAVTACAYDAVGGLPVVPFGEDRALAALIRAFDLSIRFCDAARVVTSCRLDGRAPGGMAATIRARLMGTDLLCDDRLEPALATYFRARLRARLRGEWRTPGVFDGLLRRLGLGVDEREKALRYRTFGAAWASIEATVPLLRRVRLERAELDTELPLLQRLVANARARYGCATTGVASELNRTAQPLGEALCS